jgi:endonuclease/exonuclease/phosphatase family metal-dependent hydrolase
VGTGPSVPLVTDVLRVAQLNMGSLLEPDWERRRHEVVAWLDRLDPDVVCLQEVWESPDSQNTADWVADHLAGPRRHVAFGGGPFASNVWPDRTLLFGSAVLSRWPIDDARLFPLPLADDDPMVAGVPWELVWASTAGLDVFSAHLAAAPSWAHHRVQQVLAIDDRIREVVAARSSAAAEVGRRRPGMPPILCGDFNAEPESDEIRFLTSLAVLDGRATFFQDAWRVAGDGSPGHTQDWRTNPIAASLNVHRKRIDYVFVGDPFLRAGNGGRVLSAELAFHEPLTGVLASDHAGLVVQIAWPDRPAG